MKRSMSRARKARVIPMSASLDPSPPDKIGVKEKRGVPVGADTIL